MERMPPGLSTRCHRHKIRNATDHRHIPALQAPSNGTPPSGMTAPSAIEKTVLRDPPGHNGRPRAQRIATDRGHKAPFELFRLDAYVSRR